MTPDNLTPLLERFTKLIVDEDNVYDCFDLVEKWLLSLVLRDCERCGALHLSLRSTDGKTATINKEGGL